MSPAGTREQAFVYAQSAAALMHSVARGCSAGTIFYCGCGPTPRRAPDPDFKWGGCGDDTKFGQRFARKFTASAERHKSKRKSRKALEGTLTGSAGRPKSKRKSRKSLEDRLRIKVNRHNNRAGRKVSPVMSYNKLPVAESRGR